MTRLATVIHIDTRGETEGLAELRLSLPKGHKPIDCVLILLQVAFLAARRLGASEAVCCAMAADSMGEAFDGETHDLEWQGKPSPDSN